MLDGGQVEAGDMGAREFLGHLERPNSGARANVQDLARVGQRGQVGALV